MPVETCRSHNQIKVEPVCENQMVSFITLRPLTSKDSVHFYKWASNPEVAATMTWEAYSSISEAENFLKTVADQHPWFMAICVENIPVGSITLTQGKGFASCRAELGFVLAKEFWGQGIGTQAVKMALERGFGELNIKRIDAFVDPNNKASQRVLQKAGMDCEGLLKNYVIFKGSLRDRYLYAKY